MDDTFGFGLGSVGFLWVKRCLNEGLHLGPFVAAELDDRKEGRVAVLGSRSDLPHDSVDRIQWSLLPLDVLDQQDSATALMDLLKRLDSKFGGIAVIIENVDWRPDDPVAKKFLANTNTNTVIADGGIYTIYDAVTIKEAGQLISEYDRAASSHVLNALIMRKEDSLHFVEWVEHKDIKRLAAALLGTIHRVYDGEGYAVWVR